METKRQIIHIAMSAFALLLAVLSRPAALACAVAAFLFNMFVMPRIGKGTFREHEKGRGYSTGMLMYPISVFVLILIFPAHIAAGAWAIMAFGDGFASIIGAKFGKKKLPWNPNKSWAGFIGFIITAAPAAWLIMLLSFRYCSAMHLYEPDWWAFTKCMHWEYGWNHFPYYKFAILAVSVVAGIVESLNIKLDDNLTVPITSGIYLWLIGFLPAGFFCAGGPALIQSAYIIPAVIVNVVIAALAFKLKSIDLWGAIGGFVIGVVIYNFTNYSGFLILLLFFVIGTAGTRIGYKVKESRGLAQEKHGRRSLKHALANGFAGMVFSIIYGMNEIVLRNTVESSQFIPWAIALTAAFAAATADTISSELGQLWGRRPILITTFKSVPTGVNGGVTLTGTVLGLAAATMVAAAACALNLMPWKFIWLPISAAQFGSLIDSILGATLENRGLIDNECVNFLCTLSAGLFAVIIALSMLDPHLLSHSFGWRY